MYNVQRLLQYCYLAEQLEMENDCWISTKDLTTVLEELLHLRSKILVYEPDYKYESSDSLISSASSNYRCSEDRT